MALAAVEMAMWDALGKHARLPLHALLGGAYRREIELAAYLFVADPEPCAETAARFRDEGYTTFKVKIGHDEKSDIALMEAVRGVVGDAPLRSIAMSTNAQPSARMRSACSSAGARATTDQPSASKPRTSP